MSVTRVQTTAPAPRYKESFPASWILSTATSRAINRSANEDTASGSNVASDRVRESLHPAALFLHQAGLATPSTPIDTTSDTSPKRREVSNTDTGREETNSQASISSAAGNSASEPRRAPRFRTAVKKFLPKFESEGSMVKHKPANSKTVESTSFASPLKSNSQALPSHFAFKWPDNPAISQQPTSGLYTVPEGAPNQLTADLLGRTTRTVRQTNYPDAGSSHRVGSLTAQNSAEPMTAGSGISSRSSTYGDVPSRIPRFQKGYSPMS